MRVQFSTANRGDECQSFFNFNRGYTEDTSIEVQFSSYKENTFEGGNLLKIENLLPGPRIKAALTVNTGESNRKCNTRINLTSLFRSQEIPKQNQYENIFKHMFDLSASLLLFGEEDIAKFDELYEVLKSTQRHKPLYFSSE